MNIKGVNLGGWLVLEKWMTPYLFEGTKCDDELNLYRDIKLDLLYERLNVHRQSYITERDFSIIQALGLNTVRLPVPYHMFGDVKPYLGCVEFVDKVFEWGEKYNIKIILDLHVVPGGQNGLDNSGMKGICQWHLNQDNIVTTLNIIERMAKRYGNHTALLAIEVLNEPATLDIWNHVFKHIPANVAKEKDGSTYIPRDVLENYYKECYQIIDKNCSQSVYMIIHDGFDIELWNDFMNKKDYPRVMIDCHQYINFEFTNQKDVPYEKYLKIIRNHYHEIIQKASQYHPILVGEWSLGNKMCQNEKENLSLVDQLFEEQLKIYEESFGWIFWNYKLLSQNRIEWDYESLILSYKRRKK